MKMRAMLQVLETIGYKDEHVDCDGIRIAKGGLPDAVMYEVFIYRKDLSAPYFDSTSDTDVLLRLTVGFSPTEIDNIAIVSLGGIGFCAFTAEYASLEQWLLQGVKKYAAWKPKQ